jgi:hypothetical protein
MPPTTGEALDLTQCTKESAAEAWQQELENIAKRYQVFWKCLMIEVVP